MANLLLTALGQRTLRKAACWLAANRASLPFHRSFYLAWDAWKTSGSFDFSAMLDSLNPAVQDDLLSFGMLLEELGCGVDETIEDQTIYVDGTNGSDTNGDGSLTRPFQTMAFVYDLPHNINHIVNMVLLSNVTENNPLIFNHNIGPTGCINIIGQGPPDTVVTSIGAGPFALTGVTAFNTPNTAGFEFATGLAWTTDELYGAYILFTTGAFTGYACAIAGNDGAGNIYTRGFYTGAPAAPNQFIIVRPAKTLSCPAWDLNCKGPPFLSVNKQQSRFGIYNLELAIGGGATWQQRVFNVRNECHTTLSFARVGHVNLNYPFAFDSPINHDLNYDYPNIPTLAASGIVNLEEIDSNGGNAGVLLYNSVWPPLPDYSKVEAMVGNCVTDPNRNIFGITGRGHWYLMGQYGILAQCACGVVTSLYGAAGRMRRCLYYGDPAHVGAADCFSQQSGTNELYFGYFLGGTNCISIANGDIIQNGCNAAAAPAFTGVGMEFSGSGRILSQTSPATITGANDISFPVLGVVAHPGLGAQQADALGNYESYV
jgi:hypothetical protein